MPTTPSLEAISPVDLTAVTGGCGGGRKRCCCPPPPPPEQVQAAPQLPPSDNVSVRVNVRQ